MTKNQITKTRQNDEIKDKGQKGERRDLNAGSWPVTRDSLKAEDRGRKAEHRIQNTEYRRQKFED